MRVSLVLADREGSAHGHNNAVDLRWWRMNLAQRTLHATGVWRDPRLDQYHREAERDKRSRDRLAVRRGTLIGQLAVSERLAAAALEKIKPEAARVLLQRQRQAEAARAALTAIGKVSRERGLDHEHSRGSDRGFRRQGRRGDDDFDDRRSPGHHRGRGR